MTCDFPGDGQATGTSETLSFNLVIPRKKRDTVEWLPA